MMLFCSSELMPDCLILANRVFVNSFCCIRFVLQLQVIKRSVAPENMLGSGI